MVDFATAIRDYVRFGYCTSLNNIATFGELMPLAGGGISGSAGQAARFIHNAVCNRPPDPPLPPSFTGGQCNGVQYDVTGFASYSGTAVPGGGTVISGIAIGPITGMASENRAGNLTNVFALGKVVGSNGGRYGIATIPTTYGNGNDFIKATITAATRRDGQPDECGSLPPTLPPYQPGSNTVNAPITYTNNDGTDITIGGSITFGNASVNVTGNLTIPFTLNAQVNPSVNISGDFNLNTGDINFNAGNPALPPAGCGGNSDDFAPAPDDLPPSSPASPNVPDPTPDPAKPQTRKVLVGCLATVGTIPKTVTAIFQSGSPTVYAPDLGLVSFQISVGGYTGWTEDIRVKNVRQFIACPWRGGAIAVRGTPRTGGTLSVTPIYESQTIEPTYPA